MAPNHQLSFGGAWDMANDDDDFNFESLFGSFSVTNGCDEASTAMKLNATKAPEKKDHEERRWGDESDTTGSSSEDGKSENDENMVEKEEEDVFLSLDRKRATKARFPPGCIVLVSQNQEPLPSGANYRQDVTKVFHQGTVLKVGIHADDRETIYQVQMTTNQNKVPGLMTVKEMDLQFAVGTPIWFKSSWNTTEQAVVVGSQESVASSCQDDDDRFAMSLFGSSSSNAPPRGLCYSVQVLSLTDMMIIHHATTTTSSSNVFHGVSPNDVTFRSSDDHTLQPKARSKICTSPTHDQDVMKGLLDLVESPGCSLASTVPSPSDTEKDNKETMLNCPWTTGGLQTSISSHQNKIDQGTTSNAMKSIVKVPADSSSGAATTPSSSIKRGGGDTQALCWADMVASTTNDLPILARVSTDSTASSDSTDAAAATSWSQRVQKASALKKLNEAPRVTVKLQVLPNKKTKRIQACKTKSKRDDLVAKTSAKKSNNARSKASPPINEIMRDNTRSAGEVSLVKDMELPSLSFGSHFLMDAISGKNGSRLQALTSNHDCTIDFFEAKPDGCTLYACLFAKVMGPSLMKISQCALAIEEELFYSVPPRLRGCLLAKLGLRNDYREESCGIVLSHNPFSSNSSSSNNNNMDSYCAIRAGSHLRHITLLKAGPCSKPLQEVFGFQEAKQWKEDLKHGFPTCEIDIVDATDFRCGFPGLCSHIVLSGLHFKEVFNCREEFRSRLKRRLA